MLERFPRPLIIAHRGASAYAPENTLAAFELAVQQGAHAVELDAKLTRDGEIVVFHDPVLLRTTGRAGRVSDLTLAELRELDAGSFFDARFRGEPIPTLAEVFEAVGRKVLVNVELTNYSTPRDNLVERVVDLVRRFDLAGHVLFSSFNPANLKRARGLMPEVHLGLLALPGLPGFLSRQVLARRVSYDYLHPYYTSVTPGLVEREHRLGRPVLAWTVNEAAEMRRLIEAGVDGIFTDDPLLALEQCGALP